MKHCSKCKEEKPFEDFTVSKITGYQSQCKQCVKDYYLEPENKYKRKEILKKSREQEDNKEKKKIYDALPENKVKSQERSWKWMGLNLTMAEYNQMFADQLGCCKICGRHQTQVKRKLAVDHIHGSGVVRGLLCRNCNVAIGLLGDDPDICLAASEYLRRNEHFIPA